MGRNGYYFDDEEFDDEEFEKSEYEITLTDYIEEMARLINKIEETAKDLETWDVYKPSQLQASFGEFTADVNEIIDLFSEEIGEREILSVSLELQEEIRKFYTSIAKDRNASAMTRHDMGQFAYLLGKSMVAIWKKLCDNVAGYFPDIFPKAEMEDIKKRAY
jgi:hypothetical protein